MSGQAAAASIDRDSVERLRAALGAGAPRALRELDWAARLPSAAAPGFVYLAGSCRGRPVGGGGRDLAEAAGRLAGEAAEVVAATAPPAACDAPADPAIDAAWIAGACSARIAAVQVATGRRVGVPAAAVALDGPAAAERRPGAPPASLGLAAGTDPEAARLAGLLELVERDAAAAWWREGAPPRAAEAATAAAAAAEIARMRAGADARRATGFLALGSAAGVPVVCAFSRDPDGRGLALGLKAALDPAAAAMGAAIELMQMEIALEMARLRDRQRRRAAGDAGALARAALDPDRLPAFAAGPPVAAAPAPGGFNALAARLHDLGHEVTVADLGEVASLAVAKVLVPGLRPMPGGGAARPGTPGALAALMG